MSERIFDVNRAAAALSTSPENVRRYIADEELPAFNIGTGSRKFWRITEADLAEFLRRRSSGVREVAG